MGLDKNVPGTLGAGVAHKWAWKIHGPGHLRAGVARRSNGPGHQTASRAILEPKMALYGPLAMALTLTLTLGSSIGQIWLNP